MTERSSGFTAFNMSTECTLITLHHFTKYKLCFFAYEKNVLNLAQFLSLWLFFQVCVSTE